MSKVNLVLGDPYDDGHGKATTFCIDSNFSPHEINQAYAAGVDKIGVDVVKSVAVDYEDRSILIEDVSRFIAAGFKGDIGDINYLCSDEYLELWLFTVSVGNPDFKYEIVENEDLHIGGYGLFE